ncbi:hypothetical protein [Amycolatopsis sp. lyj-90]|uniref:hypothetical protein n=1 Tax=Amycolatopsis sp. lyj-90 TaxID=2789285 RepID=UPI00397AD544
MPILIGLVVVALVAVIGVVAFVLAPSGQLAGNVSSGSAPATVRSERSESPANGFPAGGSSASPTSTSTSMPSTVADRTDGEEAARASLRNRAESDLSRAESFVGSWLPQVSSKRPGLTANGVTFDHQRIWTDFLRSLERYPDALLVRSGDFSSFRQGDFWITLVPAPHSSGPAANGWCESAGIGRDGCYAKRLAHSGGYAENTLLRK